MLSRVHSGRPAGWIEPCQPTTALKPPISAGWIHEIKHDGYRMMAWRAADRVRLLTRNRSDFGERFPLVTEAIGGLPARSCVIDGEITVCDAQGLSVFDLLRHGPRVKRNAVLFAFDLLELDGRELTREPIETRKAELAKLLHGAVPSLQLVEHLQVEGAIMYELVCALGAEGIVSKRLGSKYLPGPTKCPNWIKVKNPAAPAVRREAEEDWGKRR
jgi:bifunctional non-homologous end joining protein LigD